MAIFLAAPVVQGKGWWWGFLFPDWVSEAGWGWFSIRTQLHNTHTTVF